MVARWFCAKAVGRISALARRGAQRAGRREPLVTAWCLLLSLCAALARDPAASLTSQKFWIRLAGSQAENNPALSNKS